MIDQPFLIAGGGIAGLAAALSLSGVGRSVRLFEQAAGFEEVGAGLQMSPNGVAALKAIGAWDAIEPACVIPSEIHLRDGVSGALLQRTRLGKPFEEHYGAPYRVCHRADLLAGLVSAARNNARIALNPGRRVSGAHPANDAAVLEFEDGAIAEGCAIIAADGIGSTLRKLVCSGVEPVHRGHMIFRGLMPLGSVPPQIEADCVTLWLCPGGHVVHYPVSNWRNFNIVAAADSRGLETGWGEPAASGELLGFFSQACEPLYELLGSPAAWLRWKGTDLPTLPRWSKDNLVLTGDAAHATLPYLAQGAVMALEDACVLGGEVARIVPLADAFIRFEQLRRQRVTRVQSQSRDLGFLYHVTGLRALARNLALRIAGDRILQRRTGWIYGWQPG